MAAIDKFNYNLTRNRARRLLKKLNWNLKEEEVLVDDMVQNVALELILQDDEKRFNFIIGHTLVNTMLEWRFNVPAASHRTRVYRNQEHKEHEFESWNEDLDLSNFKLHEYSLDVEKQVMARECIRKMLDGDVKQSVDKRIRQSKLGELQISEIRMLLEKMKSNKGNTKTVVAKKYDISRALVAQICKDKSFRMQTHDSRLTEDQIADIRVLVEENDKEYSKLRIAKEYHVSCAVIDDIEKDTNYGKHVNGQKDRDKCKAICKAMLSNGSENIRDGQIERGFGSNLLASTRTQIKHLIAEHI